MCCFLSLSGRRLGGKTPPRPPPACPFWDKVWQQSPKLAAVDKARGKGGGFLTGGGVLSAQELQLKGSGKQQSPQAPTPDVSPSPRPKQGQLPALLCWKDTQPLCPALFGTSSSAFPPDWESLGPSSEEGARETRGSTTEHKAAEGPGSVRGTDKENDLPLPGLAPG